LLHGAEEQLTGDEKQQAYKKEKETQLELRVRCPALRSD
jgi:hypothetical protein